MGPWKLKQNSRGPGISPGKTQTRVGISHTSSGSLMKISHKNIHFAEIFANAKIIDTMKKVKVFSKIFFLKEDV